MFLIFFLINYIHSQEYLKTEQKHSAHLRKPQGVQLIYIQNLIIQMLLLFILNDPSNKNEVYAFLKIKNVIT